MLRTPAHSFPRHSALCLVLSALLLAPLGCGVGTLGGDPPAPNEPATPGATSPDASIPTTPQEENSALWGEGTYYGVVDNGVYDNACLAYSVVDGRAVYQGDMDLGPADAMESCDPTQERPRGVGVKKSGRWPSGKIPYVISSGLSSKVRNDILAAISHYHQKTNIRFAKRAGQSKYLTFTTGTGCRAGVGYRSSRHIRLAPHCHLGAIIHEIGHAVGLAHEQNRTDRNKYIKVLWQNVSSKYKSQFNIVSSTSYQNFGSYDYRSIMHYGPYAASIKPSSKQYPTYEVTQAGAPTPKNPQRSSRLSSRDIATLAQMYPKASGGSSGNNNSSGRTCYYGGDSGICLLKSQSCSGKWAGTGCPSGESCCVANSSGNPSPAPSKPGPGDACYADGKQGICQKTSQSCSGSYKSNICSGSSLFVRVKCCIPGGSNPTPPSSWGSCTYGSKKGTCQETSKSCNGSYKSNLCPGPSNVRCCLPSSSTPPPSSWGSCYYGNKKGTCQSTSLPCAKSYVPNLCPGPASIRCCLP